MTRRSLMAILVIASLSVLVAPLAGCVGGAQLATQALTTPPDHDPDLDRTGWLTTRAGVSFTDHVEVGGEPYIPSFDPAPTFGIGWTWRFYTFDFGAMIEHMPGARSETVDGESIRMGDQASVAASLRWRYIDRRWGGFYLRGSPGLGLFGTTETLRGAIAQRHELHPGDIGRAGVGFSFSVDTGFFITLSDEALIAIDIGVLGTLGALKVGETDESYRRYRGFVRAGVEWRL